MERERSDRGREGEAQTGVSSMVDTGEAESAAADVQNKLKGNGWRGQFRLNII